MRAALLAVAVTAVLFCPGCLESRTGACGDLICPVGRECDENRSTCVLPSQIDSCSGMADLTPCSFAGTDQGGCDHGVCHAIVCGNGVIERGELCDDGGDDDLDGCSRDCRSDERCGNGIVDQLKLEECDDENALSHDGCTSNCKSEVATWEQISPRALPGDQGHAMAFDASAGRLVRFGGHTPTGDDRNVTSEFDGVRWTDRALAGPPPGRRGAVVVHVPDERQLLVFGGQANGQVKGETFLVDGERWQELAGPGPEARVDAAAAYLHGQVILFGGARMGGSLLGDTWRYLDGAWTRLQPASSPSPRAGHALVYDGHQDRLVLFGGHDASGALHDTWEWTGSTWEPVATTRAPGATGAMAYDAGRRRTVLFGGDDAAGNSDETWEYDGDEWTQVAASGPAARRHTAMAYDPLLGAVVLTDGGIAAQGQAYRETWRYDGTWTQLPADEDASREPVRRVGGGFAYDALHARLVLAGGAQPQGMGVPSRQLGDTWHFDGSSWSAPELLASLPPSTACTSPSCNLGLVWDAAHARFVHLRQAGMGLPLETWVHDGQVWWKLNTLAAPPARGNAAVVYDAARGKVVLFGGEAMMMARADTWELDGNAWSETTPEVSPPARAEAGATFDARRGMVVIFGGHAGAMGSQTYLGDTWGYDGERWSELTDTTPGERHDAVLVYHGGTGTLFMRGGEKPPMPLGDVWELGEDPDEPGVSVWTLVAIAGGPGPARSQVAEYFPPAQAIILTGGDPTAETWSLAYRSAQPDERCAGGTDEDGDQRIDCADPDCEAKVCGDQRVCRASACVCPGGDRELACGDGQDDDCDGLADCADPDCEATPLCAMEPSCTGGQDEDNDGRRDCADPGCVGRGACEAHETRCDDGQDNDGDGKTDCADLDCFLIVCPEVLP